MSLPKAENELSWEEAQKHWKKALSDHLFVLCQTKMAVAITKRTLAGYTNSPVNAVFFSKLLERMQDQKKLKNKISNPATWGKEGERLKFDAIVGNPPYQEKDGGSQASAVPVYPYFVKQAVAMEPQYISMIMPAKWYTGGRGLDAFRAYMLNDHRIETLVDYVESGECFAGVDVAGGLCYFLWNTKHDGDCRVINHYYGNVDTTYRKLNADEVFVRNARALSIVNKVISLHEECLSTRVSSQKPFGLRTYVVPSDDGDISLRYNKGTGPFWRKDVTAGQEWIDEWKVIMSYLTSDHAGQADKDGKRRIFSTMEILPPATVCTETYIVIDAFDDENQAKNLRGYLTTRLVRFLVAQIATTQHISKSSFDFVPIQDFSRPWSDSDLYEKYGLNEADIEFVQSMIREYE